MLVQFLFFGWGLNFCMVGLAFILTSIKAFTLEKDELTQVIKFYQMRRGLIKERNRPHLRLISAALAFLPVYHTGIYAVYIWHLITKPGMWGMISATVKSDEMEIIQMVKYEFIDAKK